MFFFALQQHQAHWLLLGRYLQIQGWPLTSARTEHRTVTILRENMLLTLLATTNWSFTLGLSLVLSRPCSLETGGMSRHGFRWLLFFNTGAVWAVWTASGHFSFFPLLLLGLVASAPIGWNNCFLFFLIKILFFNCALKTYLPFCWHLCYLHKYKFWDHANGEKRNLVLAGGKYICGVFFHFRLMHYVGIFLFILYSRHQVWGLGFNHSCVLMLFPSFLAWRWKTVFHLLEEC